MHRVRLSDNKIHGGKRLELTDLLYEFKNFVMMVYHSSPNVTPDQLRVVYNINSFICNATISGLTYVTTLIYWQKDGQTHTVR